MQLFDYTSLSSQKTKIIQSFHDKGAIGVQGVPEFVKAYENFLHTSRKFIQLPTTIKTKYTPSDAFSRGWSYGIESFNNVRDAFKGSYYATYPEDFAHAPNIWPAEEVPQFKKNYLDLAKIILRTGKEILPLIDIPLTEIWGVMRMLYYGPIHTPIKGEWCGEHRDHGLLTGLCPGTYFLEGERTAQPSGTGLFIRGEEISVPQDVLLFQIGEVAELITNGAVTATEHHVRKAVGGYERYNLAFFMVPLPDYVLHSTLTKYNDRFSPGMQYMDWNDRSYAKYNTV